MNLQNSIHLVEEDAIVAAAYALVRCFTGRKRGHAREWHELEAAIRQKTPATPTFYARIAYQRSITLSFNWNPETKIMTVEGHETYGDRGKAVCSGAPDPLPFPRSDATIMQFQLGTKTVQMHEGEFKLLS